MKIRLRTLSLFMVLCILTVTFAACGVVNDPGQSETNPDTPSVTEPETLPDTEPDSGSITEPVDPPAEIVPLLERYPYTLTSADYDKFVALMDESRALLLPDGTDTEAIEAKLEEMIEHYYHIETQVLMIRLQTDIDTKDKELSDEYLFAFDMLTDAYDLYQQLYKDMDNSESAYREEFFSDWTEEELEMMRNYTPEQMEVENQLEAVKAEYRMFTEFELLQKTGEIYLQVIDLNNQLAQLKGYDNYVDYAYAEVFDRDYTPDDMEDMRAYVKEYLIPLLGVLHGDFYASLNWLSESEYNFLINFLYNDYDSLGSSAFNDYMKLLPEELGTAMMDAIVNKNAVFSDDEEKSNAGAYANYLTGEGHPICYFGPGYQDTLTVLHELGHYCAMYLNEGHDGSMDIAETHSQGNEYLFISYVYTKRASSSYDVMVKYRLFSDVLTVVMSTIVDEFEQYVYTHEITDPAELDEIMNQIRDSYASKETLDSYGVVDLNKYWKLVAIEQECYYISYGVSALASMQLFGMANENFDEAVAAYKIIVHAPSEDLGFTAMLEAAGLLSPFDEALYEMIPTLRPKR